MKLRSSSKARVWSGVGFRKKKLSLPIVLIFCSSFFLAGFYASILLSPPPPQDTSEIRRILESEVETSTKSREAIPFGETGDSNVEPIFSQVLSWRPRAVYYPGFASKEECETIIEAAKVSLKPSKLALRKGETAENTKGVRTSSGTFLSASEDESGVLGLIEKRIARATMLPQSHGEAFNILRYELGQRYLSHYDAFNPAEYGPQHSQRIASFLLYLSDVEQGGETMFPYENGLNMDISYDYKDCIGLKVKPRQGDGLLFYSLFPNGTIDPFSLHGSCDVTKGEKWVATKWIRDQTQQD